MLLGVLTGIVVRQANPEDRMRSGLAGAPAAVALTRAEENRMLSLKIAIRSMPLVFLLSGCLLVELLPEPPEHHGSASGEGPSDLRLHAAVLSDVRRELLPEQHLQEGQATCAGVRIAGDKATCSVDGSEMTILILREDLPYEAHRSKETAYFCPKESLYYYRFEGGPRNLEVWLGPRKIPFRNR